MRVTRIVLAATAALLAGCAGGGATKPAAVSASAAPARVPIGTASLTIRYPAPFYTATAAKARRPAYVNPTGAVLDILVGGHIAYNLDGVTPSDSVTVTATADGTQSIANVPVYSSTADIAVIEWDANKHVLAIGENAAVAVTAGATTAAPVTMAMNATGFALSRSADGSAAVNMSGQSLSIGLPGSRWISYVYPTDPTGGYTTAVPASGVGGLPTNVSVTGTPSDGASKFGIQLLPGYYASFGSLASTVAVTATATNPAYTVLSGGSAPTLSGLATSTLAGITANATGTITLAAGNGGVVTTLAGNGTAGYVDGTGTAAEFNGPGAAAVDSSGNLYVADYYDCTIRKISPTGVVTTLAGSGTAGYYDGTGAAAQFNTPRGIAVDSSGNVYVADYQNNRIRKISPAGAVTTLAGSGSTGSADGTGTAAQFSDPIGVAVDASGVVYVADTGSQKIRVISTAGVVTTLAGSGTAGFADGTGTAAQVNAPYGIAVDASGNVYVADDINNRIRKISSAGVVTTMAGSGTAGSADVAGTAAQFYYPTHLAVDTSGNVYVGDSLRIRKVSPAGIVTTLAGSSTSGYADGTGAAAQFELPDGVAVSAAGIVYVADQDANRIRVIRLPPIRLGRICGRPQFGPFASSSNPRP